MIFGWTKIRRPVFRMLNPVIITDSCHHTHFDDDFCGKLPIFGNFCQFLENYSCLKKIGRERDPCLENFRPKNPPIWAPHTCILNMLCYTPLAICADQIACRWTFFTNSMIATFPLIYSLPSFYYRTDKDSGAVSSYRLTETAAGKVYLAVVGGFGIHIQLVYQRKHGQFSSFYAYSG